MRPKDLHPFLAVAQAGRLGLVAERVGFAQSPLGRPDLALSVEPPASNVLAMAVRRFDQVPAHVVAGFGHHRAGERAVQRADLGGEALIGGDFHPASGFDIEFAAMCRRAGLAPGLIADLVPNETVAQRRAFPGR